MEFLFAVSSFKRVDVLAIPKPLPDVSLTLPCVSLNAKISKVTPSGLSLIEDVLDVELDELVLIDVVELLLLLDVELDDVLLEIELLEDVDVLLEVELLVVDEVLLELLDERLLVLDIVDELDLLDSLLGLEETSLLTEVDDGSLLN